MTTYGLTATGFVPKDQPTIRAELTAAVQTAFGASVDTSDASLLGQLLGILAEREGLLWDLAQAVNASQDPNQASGAALDALCALTGTLRTPASSSLVTLTLTGTPTTVVPSGSQAKTASTGIPFGTTASATIAALTAWAGATAYSVGDRRTNASRAYQCTVAGTSAGAGGPTTTASAIVDGGVTWKYLGDGTGAVDVAAAATTTGPLIGVAGDITAIQTPVGGWSSVRNLLDAKLGANVMTDGALRQLRVAELSATGVATQNAIRAALLQVSGVTSATVFVNNTDVTNSDGMPPHSVEALVQGGADADIAACLFASVAAGIAYQGTTTTSVTDSQGTAQTIKFSRPAQVLIYDDVTLTKDPATYPANGDALVAAAIVAYGAAQATGKDAVASSIAASIFPVYVAGALVAGVAGVLDVTLTKIGTAPSPSSSATIAISTRQLAVHDTSRITVHSSNGTP